MELLTSGEIHQITGDAMALYNTVAKTTMFVYKDGEKIINSSSASLPGYGSSSASSSTTYNPITGGFRCQRIYRGQHLNDRILDFHLKLPDTENYTLIKVEEPAKNFITMGNPVEKVILDNMTFNIRGNPYIRDYFGLKFYYFVLERTN